MTIKEKLIDYKNKTVKFCKEHKTGIICGVSAAAGFILACAIGKSVADNTNLNSIDYEDPEIDFSELESGDDEDFDIVEQYDWNDDTHSNNWKWIKKCAEHLELEDGEWYSFENSNSHNDGLLIGETQIFHGLEPFGRDDVYPDEEVDDEDDSEEDEIPDNSYMKTVTGFAKLIFDLKDGEQYIIEKDTNDDGSTSVYVRSM